jgi:sugar phosphate isomerase/epimerase
MRIGISRPTGPGEDLGDILAAARRHGFEGVQLKQNQYEAYTSSAEGFRDAYGELAALVRGGLIAYPGGDPAGWASKVEPAISFAAALGAGHVCICANTDASDVSAARIKAVADVLAGIGRDAQSRGVVISLHNHAGTLFESEEDLARLFDLLDPGLCGLTLDTGHTAKAGIEDAAGLVERFGGHLVNVHLKDLSAEGRFCPVGTGTVDLGSVLDAVASVGYEGWLIVDEESRDLPTDEAFRISRGYLEDRGLMP